MARGAAYFDLDRTLCRRSTEHAFAVLLMRRGWLSYRQMAGVAWWHLMYDLHLIGNFAEAKRRIVRGLLKGLPVADLEDAFADFFRTRLLPAVRPEVAAEIGLHRQVGRRIVLLTSTLDLIARPFGRKFGMDACFAATLEMSDGCYSGEIVGVLPHGEQKSRILAADARESKCDLSECFAYGDHYSDRFMLETVGHPVTVNPDRKLRTLAARRGWPIMRVHP
jgi:HAD superfamily hydrolase (TIGR01490 family)